MHTSYASELPCSTISCDPQIDVDIECPCALYLHVVIQQCQLSGEFCQAPSVAVRSRSSRFRFGLIHAPNKIQETCFWIAEHGTVRIMGCQAWHRQWRNCCHHPGLHSLQFLRPCRCVPAIVIALSALLPTCAPGSQQHLAGHVTQKYNRLRAKHAEWRTEGVILTTARLCKSWLD